MKNYYITLTLVLSSIVSILPAQKTTNSWNYGGLNRQYITYVPASYDGTTAVPVVFCLHGLGDNMNNFYGIGMNYVADTANFIVVVPQAIVDPLVQSSAWNSGASYLGYTLNGSVNDVGFINAILDTLISNYNINQRRVYSCGFSMGGFMTNRLGCQMSNRIAAIASVAGTIGGALTCTPGRTMPACHFHGTADSTVYYAGNLYGNDAETLAAFWAANNGCNASPTITALTDSQNDGLLVTHWEYTSCTNNATVEFFKVDSAEHVWLTPMNDIFYTTEIWKFFMKHTHSEAVGVQQNELTTGAVSVYPNPTNGEVFISLSNNKTPTSVVVFDATGKQVLAHKNASASIKLDMSSFEKGVYFIEVTTEEGKTTRKIILD